IWAVALSVFLAGTTGGVGYLFGMGSTDGSPKRIYSTVTSEAAVTETVTVKRQKIVTKTPEPRVSTRDDPEPGPTGVVTRTPTPKPGPTVKVTKTARPEPERECFDFDMIKIECP